MEESSSKLLRHRLEWFGLELLARAVPLMPRMLCLRLAHFIGELAFRLDRPGRAVALANIECAFGDRFSPAQRREIARKSYRNFSRTMMDLFWAPRLTPENAERYIKIVNEEPLRACCQEKRGSVVFTSHHGNFEWGSLGWGFAGLRGPIVAEDFKNPLLTDIFNRLRECSGQKIIPQESSLLRMLKAVKRGQNVGLLIDLNVPPSQASFAINAFGLKMCVTGLHTAIAQRTGAPLFPFSTDPRPDGTCRVILHPQLKFPPGASILEMTQTCWNVVEEIVTNDPSRWMWSYKHFRYKPKKGGGDYPFYANVSGNFEKVLRRQGEA
jgi:KDO2-lipid IV(A) lauroyltransferase